MASTPANPQPEPSDPHPAPSTEPGPAAADGPTVLPTPEGVDRPAPRVRPGAEDRLRLMTMALDLIPDFFYVHTFDTRFEYANKAAADYFGLGKDDLLGRRLEDVDPNPEQGKFFADICREVMREGRPRITDALPFVRPDGSKGLLRQHDFPFVDAATGQKMLLGISRDVTVERELQAERERRAGLEREMEIARQIQANLRPSQEPDLGGSGLTVAGASEPAAYAGGDFYDWFTAADGRVVICIGDVTGHGVGPAMLAAECRAFARVLLERSSMAAAFERLGALLAEDLTDGRFVTFAAAAIDPRTGKCEVLSAGHGPLLVVRGVGQGQSIERIGAHMPPVGVSMGESEPPLDVTLGPGDSLILLSDGVFEAAGDDGAQLGINAVVEALRTVAPGDVKAATGLLLDLARAHSGEQGLRDDATVVAAGRRA